MAEGFTVSAPSEAPECGNVNISWNGGSPPYDLVLYGSRLSSNGTIVQSQSFIGLPVTSLHFQLRLPVDALVVLVLTDKYGLAALGTTSSIDVIGTIIHVNGTNDNSCLFEGAGVTSTFSTSQMTSISSLPTTSTQPSSVAHPHAAPHAPLSSTQIALIVCGSVAVVAVFALALLCVCYRRKQRDIAHFVDDPGKAGFVLQNYAGI